MKQIALSVYNAVKVGGASQKDTDIKAAKNNKSQHNSIFETMTLRGVPKDFGTTKQPISNLQHTY